MVLTKTKQAVMLSWQHKTYEPSKPSLTWAALKLLITAMQQFAVNPLLHELLHAADLSLQNLAATVKWAWFGFKI